VAIPNIFSSPLAPLKITIMAECQASPCVRLDTMVNDEMKAIHMTPLELGPSHFGRLISVLFYYRMHQYCMMQWLVKAIAKLPSSSPGASLGVRNPGRPRLDPMGSRVESRD
jgi:hypothetical protein